MRAFSLVMLLVASALSAPTEEVKDVKEVMEAVESEVVPEARSLLHSAIPYNAPGYYRAAAQYVTPQQFGARLTPYKQYQQYQQYQYLPQYHAQAYYPAQGYIHNSPFYQNGAYQSGAYYQGASFYPQTYSTLTSSKKTSVVKPLVPVHSEADRFSSVVAHSAPVAAPVVRAHAAPAAPAHLVKTVDPAVKAAVYPGHPEPVHVIVKQAHDDNFDGSFAYSYETDHGIAVESTGFLKNAGTPDQVQVMQGSYTYYTPEGIPITTTYIADENGFQVQGDHLPQPPEMPEAIAKAIAYQRSLPPSEEDLVEEARIAAKNTLKH